MALGKDDLRIKRDSDGASQGFVTDPAQQQAIEHTASPKNFPLNASGNTPVGQGQNYDASESQGDKHLSHLEWREGAGQKSLDNSKSSFARFHDSSYMDVGTEGQLSLLRRRVDTAAINTAGPVFSALGALWAGSATGALRYSLDGGTTWADCTITGAGGDATISGFTTDGSRVYFSVSGGVAPGVWANTAAAINVFTRFPNGAGTATNGPIQALAYNGGFLFAATAFDAGIISSADGSYTHHTPDFLNTTNTTVALVSDQNAVYWVVSQGSRSYVYQLRWDASANTMTTEQYDEFPQGYTATCAVGYLGNIDVGGYFESRVGGVGKGSVYRTSNGYMALLFDIGPTPESTPVPTARENDNRIRSACAGVKDTYWLTERACYRWDMDDGGYSHVFDFLGAGAVTRVTNQFDTPALPTGGTIHTEGLYTVHVFESTGENHFVIPLHSDKDGNPLTALPVEYVVVGGGGAGNSGGGGGGQVLEVSMPLTGDVTITVGAGGQSSVVAEGATVKATAVAGGAGGAVDANGSAGASGGGAGSSITPKTGGTASAGHDGGAGDYEAGGHAPAGGGGGAGAAGTNATEGLEGD